MTNSRGSRSRSLMQRENSTRQVENHPTNMPEALPEDDLRRHLDRSRGLINELTANHSRRNAQRARSVEHNPDQHAGQTNIHLNVSVPWNGMSNPNIQVPMGYSMLPTIPCTLGGTLMQYQHGVSQQGVSCPTQGFAQMCQPWPGTPEYYFVASTPQVSIAEQWQLAPQHVQQPVDQLTAHLGKSLPGRSTQNHDSEKIELADRSRRPNREECESHHQPNVTQRRSVFDRIRKSVRSRLGPQNDRSHSRSKSRRATEADGNNMEKATGRPVSYL